MTQPLSSFISAVRTAPTLDDERFVVATEKAEIRAYLRKMDPEMRPRVVSKLVFLDMIGENPAWGQMEAIHLMTNDRFSYKRVGYICTGILLDQTNELSVLVTQTLLRDMASSDPNIQCLALDFLANIGSAEVCRACATEVKKLMTTEHHSRVMKKAGMATVRIIRKNPDLSDDYKNAVQPLLNSNNHGIVISGINLVMAMIEVEPKLIKAWAQFNVPFTKILKTLTTCRPLKEFSFGVFNDPFMQVKCLRALGLLKKKNDELETILQQIISSTETKRNSGRSILYQTVETICAVSKKASLRGLAFTQIGRLLSMKDPNVLYSSLSVFARVLYSQNSVLNRGSADSMALQRYRSQITKCLNHNDPSIRRRALDVISALIDENNAESLIPEILMYLKLADRDFRAELVSKIYTATQRFAPNDQWKFDTVHQILIDSGNYVSSDIVSSFCELITTTPSIQQHAVQKLTESLINFNDNQTLMQIASFVIGEFSTVDNGALDSLSHIVLLPQTIPETQLYIITAISKMATRFNQKEKVTAILNKMLVSNNLELQQRCGEMMKLLSHPEVCEEMLAPIEQAEETPQTQTPQIVMDQSTQPQQKDLLNDVLLEFDSPSPQTPVSSSTVTDSLLDLDFSTPAPAAPAPAPAPTPKPTPAPAPMPVRAPQPQIPAATELARQPDYVIYGQARGNPQDSRQIALKLIICGTGSSKFTDFRTDYQVSAGWKMNVQAADGNVLMPAGGPPLSQIVYLMNVSNVSYAPFQMQMRLSYKFGSQPINEVVAISMLPPVQ